MSLKCSLFGHAFDDGEVEREREEQGSEVVITIRETETCTRCGAERVVSENKEVTTLETPSDIVGDDLADADEATTAAAEETDSDPDTAGAGTVSQTRPAAADNGSGAASGGVASGDAGSGSTPGPGPASDPDPDEDDGVILDADDEEPDDGRAPGEWPEEDEDEADAAATDGPADAVPEWPEEDDDGDEEDWAPETDSETPTEVEPTSTAVTVPEGTFHCPECAFSTPVEDSSLRAGDFCPECHRGSLEHRT